MRWISRDRSTACIGGALALACTAEPRVPLQCLGAKEVVYDPYGHTICMASCYDDLDCPRGTLCAKYNETSRGACKLPSELQQTSRSALLDGFGVAEMVAELKVEGGYELAWSAPEGVTLVNCVLFSCPPAFRIPLDEELDGQGTWGNPEADRSQVEIANYDRCVVASERSALMEGRFNLRERDNVHIVPSALTDTLPDHDEDQVKECLGYGCAPITELYAGCWAYDETSIVAATPLFAVDTALGIYNYHGAFADKGSCSTELTSDDRLVDNFRVCRRADALEATLYGVCACPGEPTPKDAEGRCADSAPCKRPCVSDCDCADDPSSSGACNQVAGAVGYCVDTTCTAFPEY